jgi:pimeloyl-ACP methyl ester carboxylesterase
MALLEERCARHDGGSVRYLIGGAGPPLVLCHGFLGSAENFETWFDELSLIRTLVVPDLPGCGESAPLRGVRHTTGRLAAAVDAVCVDAGVERFDIGGLCLGASVAMAVLQRRPEAVDHLVLHTPLLAPALVRRRFHYKRLVVEGDNVDTAAAETNFRNQLRAVPRALREWQLEEVADAGHGWIASYVRRQLEVITAFLLDRPLPRPAAVARVA